MYVGSNQTEFPMKPRRKLSRSAPRACESSIECLEERTLLTGNVLAAIVRGGNLLVLGDSKANQIAIQSTSSGALQISSLDGTTKINGSTNPFTANGVTGGVYIFLGQGNDVLQIGVGGSTPAVSPAVPITTTSIPQNLLVVTGNGNDTVTIENTAIGGSAAILGGIGTDVFTVGSPATGIPVSVGSNLLVEGGFGNSTIAVFDANVTGNLTLIGNGSNDHIQVGYDEGLGIIGDESDTGHVNVGGNLTITDSPSPFGFLFGGLGCFATIAESCDPSSIGFAGCYTFTGGCNFGWIFGSLINCGLGNCVSGGEHVAVADVDVTGNLSIQTGSGSDEILIGAAHTPATDSNPLINLVFGPVSVGGNLKVKSGAGNDTVLLVEVTVTGNTDLDSGTGNDNIGVLDSSSFTGDFAVHAGRGNDSIVLSTDSFTSSVTIYGGKGIDIVGLADSLFEGSVTINGGAGNDTFLTTQVPFANDFAGGPPVLNSVETSSEVSATDFVAAFPWVSALLEA
jgi:large repetitive protein